MTEFSAPHDHSPLTPSPDLDRILLEAAQFYLLAEPSENTIYEITPPDEGQFRRDVRNMWQQRIGGGNDAQFEADFEEIRRQIEAKGAEALIDEQRAKRAEARQARAETPDTPTTPQVVKQMGSSGIGRFFRRKDR